MTARLLLAAIAAFALAGCPPAYSSGARSRKDGRPSAAFPTAWSDRAPAPPIPPPSPGPMVAPRASSGIATGTRIAVLEFRGPMQTDLLATFADEARGAALDALRGSGATVMTRESTVLILKDMGRDSTCVEGECEVETARNIGADFVITGEVIHVMDTYIATIKLHETGGGSLLGTERVQAPDPLALLEMIRPASTRLFR